MFDREFLDFVDRQNLSSESRNLLIDNTKKILERTELLDNRESSNCQIVVGEVQSGKTMNFTGLIALAHDNEFAIVIVIAGTTNTLHNQTAARLFHDLKCEGNGGVPQWGFIEKPTAKKLEENLQLLNESLGFWKDPRAPREFKQTVIITCLKNAKGLLEVKNLLQKFGEKNDLAKLKVLIVDDEGDEAGLNLDHAIDSESSVYSSIKQLRESFARHSYVMYTATPQGPLLISIQDSLSPKFVTLLTSGPDYLGGSELFDPDGSFIMRIPQLEATAVFDSDHGAPVPKSLKIALAYYLLALRIAQFRGNPKPLSMLIHPSVSVDLHDSYKTWVERVLSGWSTILADSSEGLYDLEKREYFIPAMNELLKTTELPEGFELDRILSDMKYWIGNIGIRIANKDHSDIDVKQWLTKPGWILIGGNKLSRGFTIHNLAVSYMPRNIGVGNADVIQQRGRFFGYKNHYKELLRGWFFQDQIAAFSEYVEHEKSMRAALKELDDTNTLLRDWRRKFLLDEKYQPVRSKVISLGIAHLRLKSFKQQKIYDKSLQGLHSETFNRVLSMTSALSLMPRDLRSNRNNYYCEVKLDDALELLLDWPANIDNKRELDDIIWAVKTQQESGKVTKAVIVLMDYDPKSKTLITNERSLLRDTPIPELSVDDHNIENLWQGPDRDSGVKYPGDSEMFIEEALTIQVHSIKPVFPGLNLDPVVALAIIMPKNLTGMIVEV